MSDSELSADPGTPVPSDNELEQSLRREVMKVSKTGDEVTVNRIRGASEKRLGLPEGFYKGHATWKDRSKEVIHDQVDTEAEVPSSPELKKSRPAKPVKATKRKSQDPEPGPPKKRKISNEAPEDKASPPPSLKSDQIQPDKKPKRGSRTSRPSEKPAKGSKSKKPAKDEDEVEQAPEPEEEDSKLTTVHDSDSDLSVLIDDEPTKEKSGKGKDSQDKSSKTSKMKLKAKEEVDPDQADIRRLQGWLVKCGIRKVWGKELKPFETPKAKIKHLKEMLSDAGMTGRYSAEKATQIKEAREMAADIEAIKEGEERWGTGDHDEPSDGERPQRKLVRGSKHFDFLSSDGEETD